MSFEITVTVLIKFKLKLHIFSCSGLCSPVSADHDKFPLVVAARRPGGEEAGGEDDTKHLQETDC